MRRSIAFCAGGAVIAAGAVFGAVRHAGAQTLVENSAEFRMQLDFQVKDAALQKMLPAGWEPQVATQGPAKDCNIRLIFIDRVDVTVPTTPRKHRASSSTSPFPSSRPGPAMAAR